MLNLANQLRGNNADIPSDVLIDSNKGLRDPIAARIPRDNAVIVDTAANMLAIQMLQVLGGRHHNEARRIGPIAARSIMTFVYFTRSKTTQYLSTAEGKARMMINYMHTAFESNVGIYSALPANWYEKLRKLTRSLAFTANVVLPPATELIQNDFRMFMQNKPANPLSRLFYWYRFKDEAIESGAYKKKDLDAVGIIGLDGNIVNYGDRGLYVDTQNTKNDIINTVNSGVETVGNTYQTVSSTVGDYLSSFGDEFVKFAEYPATYIGL